MFSRKIVGLLVCVPFFAFAEPPTGWKLQERKVVSQGYASESRYHIKVEETYVPSNMDALLASIHQRRSQTQQTQNHNILQLTGHNYPKPGQPFFFRVEPRRYFNYYIKNNVLSRIAKEQLGVSDNIPSGVCVYFDGRNFSWCR